MAFREKIAFLFDVDNTLLDNDRVEEDLRHHLEREFGAESRDRYFAIFEELRSELRYADYLGALQRYRLEEVCDPRVLRMSSSLVDYPFADRLYRGALDPKNISSYPPAYVTVQEIGDLANYSPAQLLEETAARR